MFVLRVQPIVICEFYFWSKYFEPHLELSRQMAYISHA